VKELDVFLEFGGFFGNIFSAGDGGGILALRAILLIVQSGQALTSLFPGPTASQER
jgi:hypothetical protein